MFLDKKSSLLEILILLLKKDKLPFRLLGIRKRGKVVGIPVPLAYTSQYYDCFRTLLIFAKKSTNLRQFSYLYSFLTDNTKFINKDLYSKKIVAYKTASSSIRFSNFKASRYR
jgi:hypothetical protein